MPRLVRKVLCYVTRGEELLVLTHLDVPLERAGVQVPAGTIAPGESPQQAALRELREETGLQDVHVVCLLGTDTYDTAPTRGEVQERHVVHLRVAGDVPQPWRAGEPDPDDGGPVIRWECWWLPLADAHVLAAGQGRLVHRLVRPRQLGRGRQSSLSSDGPG